MTNREAWPIYVFKTESGSIVACEAGDPAKVRHFAESMADLTESTVRVYCDGQWYYKITYRAR